MRPERIVTLLPEVVQRAAPAGSVIDALLAVMAAQHDSVEALLADFGRYVDPYRCPGDFVPVLAAWVGLDWLVARRVDADPGLQQRPQVPEQAMRNLVFHAAELAKQRGTANGLRRTLELATGSTGFDVRPRRRPGFDFEVRCPASARATAVLVAHIVDHDKPAFTTAVIGFGDDEAVPLTELLASTDADPSSSRRPPAASSDQKGSMP